MKEICFFFSCQILLLIRKSLCSPKNKANVILINCKDCFLKFNDVFFFFFLVIKINSVNLRQLQIKILSRYALVSVTTTKIILLHVNLFLYMIFACQLKHQGGCIKRQCVIAVLASWRFNTLCERWFVYSLISSIFSMILQLLASDLVVSIDETTYLRAIVDCVG